MLRASATPTMSSSSAKREVRRDLDEERRALAPGLSSSVARLERTRHEIVESRSPLEASQTRRVRRRDIDGDVIAKAGERRDADRVIAAAIGRCLVRSDIHANDARRAAPRLEPPRHRLDALAVEAVAVDHGLIRRQAKQARPRVARLRQRRHATDLDGAKAKAQATIDRLAVLVEAGGEAERIWKSTTERLDCEALIVRARRGARQQPHGRDREMMGALGIEPRDERAREPIAEAQHHGERSRSAWRQAMSTIGAERHLLDEANCRQGQCPVEMREESAAARRLETQRRAERLRVDRNQDEIIASGKMPRGRFRQLLGCREMDEAVALVDRRAAIDALLLGAPPLGVSADLEDEAHDHPRFTIPTDIHVIRAPRDRLSRRATNEMTRRSRANKPRRDST